MRSKRPNLGCDRYREGRLGKKHAPLRSHCTTSLNNSASFIRWIFVDEGGNLCYCRCSLLSTFVQHKTHKSNEESSTFAEDTSLLAFASAGYSLKLSSRLKRAFRQTSHPLHQPHAVHCLIRSHSFILRSECAFDPAGCIPNRSTLPRRRYSCFRIIVVL